MIESPTTRDEFFAALRENQERPKGRATAAVAEELVDAAEAFGDAEVTVSAVVALMSAYHGSGESVKFPVAFARLLQLWDENPKAFDEYEVHRLFWYFKWVTSGLLSTPDVPLAAIRGWVAEMRRRYQVAGHELQPVYAQEFFLARHLGEDEQLPYELWATRGRSELSDCQACEARSRAGYHFRRGEDARGLAELQPTFDGRSTCDEEPHSSQAQALQPLLRLGRYDEARAMHLNGYRKVRGNEAELDAIGMHLEFCALTGNEARGLELLAQNRAAFAFAASPSGRLEFLTGAEVLLARLIETGHGELPCAGPLGRDWTVASLRDEVAAQADALASRFDARNGNDVTSARRRERLAARPFVASLNLGVQTTALVRPADEARAEVSAPPTAAVAAGGEGVTQAGSVVDLPEDFDELLAEARRLDRTGHPRTRALWDAVIARLEIGAEDGTGHGTGHGTGDGAEDGSEDRSASVGGADELVRGEIASELAQRAASDGDWDGCAARLAEAVDFYTRAGDEGRRIAAEARIVWCAAVRDGITETGAAAETAWPLLDELMTRVDTFLAGDFEDDEQRRYALSRKFVVRHCRVFTARHAALRPDGPETYARWSEVFTAEAQALIDEGTAADVWTQPSVAYEVLSEFQSTHGHPVEGEASARRALEIFEQQGWAWRLPRARLLLGLALGGQNRSAEAMAELERGLAEAPAEVPAGELTPLHRMLGAMAVRARQFPTAVRALSEAAARLDREGEPLEARETRLQLGRALCAQGAVGDGVAVLESLLDASGTADAATEQPTGGAAGDEAGDEAGAATDAGAGDATAGAPSQAEQLTAQIRADLAGALLSLGEHRDAAVQFLRLADQVGRWPEKAPLTTAAAGAAGALALAGNWDGARAALARAVESNREAPCLPDLTDALRTLASEAVDARGADAVAEALGYLDQADQLREEFAEAAREQFRSVDVDVAQCLFTRGRVFATVGRHEEAVAALDRSVAIYDGAGFAKARPRFEALRLAGLVEARGLDRVPAARSRLDKAAAEADAAGLPDAATTLRRLRDSLS